MSMPNRLIAAPIAMLGLMAAAADVPGTAPPRAIVRNASDPALQWGACPALFPAGCQIAVLQGDPAKPHADVLLRIAGGLALPAHSHSSAEHIVLIEGELEVRYEGQPAAVLKRGDFAYGPPNLPHAARCVSSTPCTLFIAFEQAVDAIPHAGPLR